jgi:hypothetical protein
MVPPLSLFLLCSLTEIAQAKGLTTLGSDRESNICRF